MLIGQAMASTTIFLNLNVSHKLQVYLKIIGLVGNKDFFFWGVGRRNEEDGLEITGEKRIFEF